MCVLAQQAILLLLLLSLMFVNIVLIQMVKQQCNRIGLSSVLVARTLSIGVVVVIDSVSRLRGTFHLFGSEVNLLAILEVERDRMDLPVGDLLIAAARRCRIETKLDRTYDTGDVPAAAMARCQTAGVGRVRTRLWMQAALDQKGLPRFSFRFRQVDVKEKDEKALQ